ncbi:hypothetical protein [Fulvivirga sp.]|jgi:hypothetical protein|uniref:hypothetical protein n=1 Tax=Fulvivirga sp. TaxID=1931237 RepID=UPI0032EC6B7E
MIIRTALLHSKKIFTVLVLLTISMTIYAQEESEGAAIPLDHFYAKPKGDNAFRKLLSKLHFGLSTGYGRTFYSQDLGDYALLQQQDSTPLIFDKGVNISGGSVPNGYRYWFNTVNQSDNVSYTGNDFLISSDSADLTFKAPGTSIPLTATVHIELMDKYKIGGGFQFEYHRVGQFKAVNFSDTVASITPNFGSTFFKRYFLILGAKVYRYYEYTLAVDAQIGAYKLSSKFDKSLIDKGVYVNLGVTIERELSEYFTAFVRPSFDYKNYTISLPESSSSINTSMNALYIGLGVTYRIPELRRCFLKQCTTQVNHQHGNGLYRSRIHPFYKKQNPHHGENYPRLIKYKRKNRKKMDPY